MVNVVKKILSFVRCVVLLVSGGVVAACVVGPLWVFWHGVLHRPDLINGLFAEFNLHE